MDGLRPCRPVARARQTSRRLLGDGMENWPLTSPGKTKRICGCLRISMVTRILFATFLASLPLSFPCPATSSGSIPTYVGSEVCQPCHPNEYKSFMEYAKKSRSFHSIERMQKGLSKDEIKQCYSCHTTGYGRPGGFVSPEKTPHLKNAGCEVCHGPGSLHIKTEDSSDIRAKLTMKDCETCHTSERIRAFRFRPLIHGGAH